MLRENSNKEDKGTVLLSLEVLRLFAEMAKLPIIIIVDIPQEVKGGQKGRARCILHPSLDRSVSQDRRTTMTVSVTREQMR